MVENWTLLGYYAACSGNSLQFFRTPDWYQFQGSKIFQLTGCPEKSARNYDYMLHNSPEEHSSHVLYGRNLRSCKNKAVFRWNIFSLFLCYVNVLSYMDSTYHSQWGLSFATCTVTLVTKITRPVQVVLILWVNTTVQWIKKTMLICLVPEQHNTDTSIASSSS